ncbi:MAG: DUF3494 domain-containing protein [bacterium]|nr:DUF3494 domain-containing protein [bacterium]
MNRSFRGAPARMLAATVCLSSVASAQVADATLWASDDVNRTIYHVTQDGVVLSSFHSGSISGLAIDPFDDSIWTAKEGFSRIVHFDRQGNELGFFESTTFSSAATRPEGIAVDFTDGTLWIVEDETLGVYNAETDGTLIGSFLTTTFDPAAMSPQSVAADPFDGTLWITDNAADAIYNITATGALISSFPTEAFAQSANNPQGISVDELNGTLWVTDRITHTIYNLERDGTEIYSFDSLLFGSADPTGIAFDRPTGAFDLGQAGDFGLLGCAAVSLYHSSTGIEGDVALAPGSYQNFHGGFIDGSLLVDPNANNNHNSGAQISGAVLARDLAPAIDDALTAAETAAALTPTQTFGNIRTNLTIEGTDGTNVIDIQRVSLRYGEQLTLSGTPSSKFILNVHGRFRLRLFSKLALEGGVRAENVLVNVIHHGSSVRIAGFSEFNGILLAPNRRVRVAWHSLVQGTVIAGRSFAMWGGSTIRH